MNIRNSIIFPAHRAPMRLRSNKLRSGMLQTFCRIFISKEFRMDIMPANNGKYVSSNRGELGPFVQTVQFPYIPYAVLACCLRHIGQYQSSLIAERGSPQPCNWMKYQFNSYTLRPISRAGSHRTSASRQN